MRLSYSERLPYGRFHPSLTMHPGALRALEFDRIVAAVCAYAQTPGGAARLAAIHRSPSGRHGRPRLAATAETVRFLGDDQIHLQAPADLLEILGAASVLRVARWSRCTSWGSSHFWLRLRAPRRGSDAPGPFRSSRRIADTTASFQREIADVRRKIDPGGEVVDDASPELRSIRDRLRKQRARLRGTLESYLRGKDTSKYLQQQIVTDRNGRYVLVVRAEHRSAIPGIVHGSSGTGASLYLEPLSTVEINNDIVELEQQESEEVHRILVALSDRFRGRGDDVTRTVAAATELDVLQASAQFSLRVDGIEPKLSADGRLELRGARHPLLTGKAVPVDVLFIPPVNVVVITGPNTGGKTVALKTSGLLSLIAQAGLLIPAAEGSQVPVFQCVFADIGDDQSISANLSTFSAHIKRIVDMNAELASAGAGAARRSRRGNRPERRRRARDGDHRPLPPTGRDGGRDDALRFSEDLRGHHRRRRRGWIRLRSADVRTHLPAQLRLAGQQPGAGDCHPVGHAGHDHRAGAAHRSERESQLAEHLARVQRDMQALEHDHRLAARERKMLEETTAKLHAREHELRHREERSQARLDERIEERLRDARREIDSVVDRAQGQDRQARVRRRAPHGAAGTDRADRRCARRGPRRD